MSDLISRKSILDKMENILLNANLTIGEHTLLTGVINEISIEPTAYDVSKVVAELEDEQEKLETNMFARGLDDWYGEHCNGISEGIDKAIDIVRKGGVK